MKSSKKIAYLLKMFPRFSETFILNEILELERQGVFLHIYSMKNPNESFKQKGVNKVMSTITYIPEPICFLPIMFLKNIKTTLPIVTSNLKLFVKSPARYFQAWIFCLRIKDAKACKRLLTAAYIARIFQKEGIEHLHAHFANAPTTVAMFVHLLTGIPYSFTAHAKDIYLSKKNILQKEICEAEFVVTCTDYNRKYLAGISKNGTPIHTVYHGIDYKVFVNRKDEKKCLDKSNEFPKDQPIILSVGRLVEKKGFDCLIRACTLLQNWDIDFQCQIVGEGPLESTLKELIRDIKLEDKIQILKFLPQERLVSKYEQAALFALSCQITKNGDRDGIPNVLLEAMAMGLPVVATSVSGITELVESEQNGLLVPPEDHFALARAMKQILVKPDAYKSFGHKGQEKIKQDFGLKLNVSRLINLFDGKVVL